MSLFMVFMIAVSLSMDAFSLSLAYGTLNMGVKERHKLTVIVGIYHFIMPIIGMLIGNNIVKFLPFSPDVLVFIVLFFIGVEMMYESFKEESATAIMKFSDYLLFGFAVSLDSFSVGIGLNAIYSKPFVACLLFSVSSAIFTHFGLLLGTKINRVVGKISTFFGGLSLIMIGIHYLF